MAFYNALAGTIRYQAVLFGGLILAVDFTTYLTKYLLFRKTKSKGSMVTLQPPRYPRSPSDPVRLLPPSPIGAAAATASRRVLTPPSPPCDCAHRRQGRSRRRLLLPLLRDRKPTAASLRGRPTAHRRVPAPFTPIVGRADLL